MGSTCETRLGHDVDYPVGLTLVENLLITVDWLIRLFVPYYLYLEWYGIIVIFFCFQALSFHFFK